MSGRDISSVSWTNLRLDLSPRSVAVVDAFVAFAAFAAGCLSGLLLLLSPSQRSFVAAVVVVALAAGSVGPVVSLAAVGSCLLINRLWKKKEKS